MNQIVRRRRLLYLGFAFPPGMQAMFPGTNPAGHGFETQMVAALRPHFEIRSAGVLPTQIPPLPLAADPASGVDHKVILLDRPPELWHRLRSVAKLKQQYRLWRAAGWAPDAVLSYNLSPIYNNFLRWLRGQPACPKLVVLLLDSSHLGRTLPPFKRFRYRFKPLVIPDAEMVREFDGCIGLSRSTEQFFSPRGIPFLWMPGGCTPARACREPPGPAHGEAQAPISFGYFGALAAHSGVMPLAEGFLASQISNPLHICGHGKLADDIARLARSHARLQFHGLLPSQDDCLRLAVSWDVLVNPRPASPGNENNFPSKVFEYALCGRVIMTTRLAGVDAVLGPEAFYLDAERLKDDLRTQLPAIAAMPRAELRRRGNALCERVTAHYSWPQQAASMAEFITRLL